MEKSVVGSFLRNNGKNIWSMLCVRTAQWCLLLLISSRVSRGENEIDVCQKVKISGTSFQTSREGLYDIMDSSQYCNGRPSYRHEDDGGFLFYIEDDHRWTGWLVGNTICYNLGGIAVDSSASDPSRVSTHVYWQELSNNIWYINRGLEVTCDDGGGLSVWEIVGIVTVCVLVLTLIIVIIGCYVKKHQKGPLDSRGSRHNRHNQVSPRSTSFWSRTSTAWTTSASSATPMSQRNIIMEAPSYSPPNPQNQGASNDPSFGPPPSYQDSLEHQVYDLDRISEVRNNTRDTTQANPDVTAGTRQQTQDNGRPVFSPPPAYSYTVV